MMQCFSRVCVVVCMLVTVLHASSSYSFFYNPLSEAEHLLDNSDSEQGNFLLNGSSYLEQQMLEQHGSRKFSLNIGFRPSYRFFVAKNYWCDVSLCCAFPAAMEYPWRDLSVTREIGEPTSLRKEKAIIGFGFKIGKPSLSVGKKLFETTREACSVYGVLRVSRLDDLVELYTDKTFFLDELNTQSLKGFSSVKRCPCYNFIRDITDNRIGIGFAYKRLLYDAEKNNDKKLWVSVGCEPHIILGRAQHQGIAYEKEPYSADWSYDKQLRYQRSVPQYESIWCHVASHFGCDASCVLDYHFGASSLRMSYLCTLFTAPTLSVIWMNEAVSEHYPEETIFDTGEFFTPIGDTVRSQRNTIDALHRLVFSYVYTMTDGSQFGVTWAPTIHPTIYGTLGAESYVFTQQQIGDYGDIGSKLGLFYRF